MEEQFDPTLIVKIPDNHIHLVIEAATGHLTRKAKSELISWIVEQNIEAYHHGTDVAFRFTNNSDMVHFCMKWNIVN